MKMFRIIYLMIILLVAGCPIDSNSLEESARNTTLEWSRLAYWPECANTAKAVTRGSAFTREFEYNFECPVHEIEQWLSASSGIKDANVVKEGKWTVYRIKPGGGAQFAELKVHIDSGVVNLRVFWS